MPTSDRGPTADRAGCPESYGILLTKSALWHEAWPGLAWPGIGASTAMNSDIAYAIWGSCYDGSARRHSGGAESSPLPGGMLSVDRVMATTSSVEWAPSFVIRLRR